MKNAAVTAQTVKCLTKALVKFHSNINSKDVSVKSIYIDDDINDAIKQARKYYKKIEKGYHISGLSELIANDNNKMLDGIIRRHSTVKRNPLFDKKRNKYVKTEIKEPKNIGLFGFRQGALISLMRSLDRMEGKNDDM